MAHSVSELTAQFGQVLEAKNANCEKHGEYLTRLTGMGKTRQAMWTPCTKCLDEKIEQENAAHQQQMREQHAKDSLERKLGRASIPPRFAVKSFEDYKADTKEQQRALRMCKDYADNFEQYRKSGTSILLLGDVGTGKTHLAASIANQVVRETKFTAVYTTASTIVRHVKSTFDKESELTEGQAYGVYSAMDLLVIDEVGVQNATEFELTVMFEVVNSRYEEMLPTLVISNRSIEDLPKFLGDRVVDRLREGGGKMVPFDWKSARRGVA